MLQLYLVKMELRVALVLFCSFLVVVFGEKPCENHKKCLPFENCSKYQSYVGKPYRSWPLDVKKEVKPLYCGMEQGITGRIYKICCKLSGRSLLNLEKCGIQIKPRISHGDIAEIFQFPWMALIGGKGQPFHCGGSLIAESFVLTAGHCRRKKVTFVRVGETNLSTPIDCMYFDDSICADPYQDIPVAKFVVHENYSTSKRKNDIALIKLTRPVQLNENVIPICLPLPELLPEKLPVNMTVSGWGNTEHQNGTSNELRFVHIPIVEQTECQEFFRRYNDVITIDNSQVCAGGGDNLSDNCQGDSGGPLQYFGIERFVIHGVVSFGLRTCGWERAIGAYTKVPEFLDWILENLE